MFAIEIVQTVIPDLVEAFARLLPQQNPDALQPTAEQLAEVVEAPGNSLLVARDQQGTIIGTLTLIVFPTPSGTSGYIEDVVVDAAVRRQGIGEALVREALRIAAERGAIKTDLLSATSRPAAVRLYQRVGFERFETNVWRYVHVS
jgi:ribosomal protein S18 acetylase RimI-like enzyme